MGAIVAKWSWLLRRDSDSDDDGGGGGNYYCTGWCSSDYARWIIAAVIIVAVVVVCVALWFLSIRRATGYWALTSWRARQRAAEAGVAGRDAEGGAHARGPSTRRRRRRTRGFEGDVDPVPTYHATPGDGDLGGYDQYGNYTALEEYEPPPYEPPKAVLRVSSHEYDDTYELDNYRTASVTEEFERIPQEPRRSSERDA